MTYHYKRAYTHYRLVLSLETFEQLGMHRYRCIWCIHCSGSLLPSTVHSMLALVNIIHIHTSGCTLSISVKPRSATHFPTSTASTGLQHLLVGAHVHLVWFRAMSHYMWPSPHTNIFHTSKLLVSLGGHQLEPCSPEHEHKFALLAAQVFKYSCGNKGREQHALIPMGLLVVCDTCTQLVWYIHHL